MIRDVLYVRFCFDQLKGKPGQSKVDTSQYWPYMSAYVKMCGEAGKSV